MSSPWRACNHICIYIYTYITLHYITLHYTTLHYITLHYITLHYITYTHTHIHTYTLRHTHTHTHTYTHTHIHVHVHTCTCTCTYTCTYTFILALTFTGFHKPFALFHVSGSVVCVGPAQGGGPHRVLCDFLGKCLEPVEDSWKIHMFANLVFRRIIYRNNKDSKDSKDSSLCK